MNAIDRIKAEKIYAFDGEKLVLIANNYNELETYIIDHFGKESRKHECYFEARNYYNAWEWYGGFASDLYCLGFYVNPSEDIQKILSLENCKRKLKAGEYN